MKYFKIKNGKWLKERTHLDFDCDYRCWEATVLIPETMYLKEGKYHTEMPILNYNEHSEESGFKGYVIEFSGKNNREIIKQVNEVMQQIVDGTIFNNPKFKDKLEAANIFSFTERND